jgi:hypothetical protein
MKGIVGHKIHYCIVQPKMANKYEVKMVVVGNKAVFRAFNSRQHYDRSIGQDKQLESFALDAYRALITSVPYAITDCIIRIDFFQSMTGRFQVNEFESYDALIAAGGRGDVIKARKNGIATSFMEEYWRKHIREICCPIR